MKYTKQILEDAVKKSKSVTEVMRIVNSPMSGGCHCHISKKIKEYGIDTSHFQSSVAGMIESAKKRVENKRKTADSILVHSSIDKRIKTRILNRALRDIGREYKCEKCKINSYNGLPITLEIDHIDGDWKNNTRENLRYLCPNCHSQTDTSYRKNMKISDQQILDACKIHSCIIDVSEQLGVKGKWHYYTRIRKVAEKNGIKMLSYLEKFEMNRIPKVSTDPNWRTKPKHYCRKVERPSKEHLTNLIDSVPIETIGKQYGVSGNAVRKWCKTYEIQTKPVGYWQKKQFGKI